MHIIYDYETGLYYLRSRYYNPVWCRFINADSLVKGNLFNYCEDNPVNAFDKDGNMPSFVEEYNEDKATKLLFQACKAMCSG